MKERRSTTVNCPKEKHSNEAAFVPIEKPNHILATVAFKADKTASNTGAGDVALNVKNSEKVVVEPVSTLG